MIMTFKTFALSFIVIFITSISFSQKNDNYEKIYYENPETSSSDMFGISLKNIVSQKDHCKMSVKITNNTSDFLLVEPQNSKFKYPEFEKNPSIKDFFVKPNKSKSKTFMVNGGDEFLQESFSVNIGNVFHVPQGTKDEAPDFKLPASKNSFETANFKVNLVKYSASTKEAKAIYEVTYVGNEIAILNPANLSVSAQRRKSDEIVTYANDNKKAEPIILRKGDNAKIVAVFHIPGKIVDMQFATMNIQWNDTFTESTLVLLPQTSFDIKINQPLTEEKK